MKKVIAVALVLIAACAELTAQSNRVKLFDFRTEARSNPPRITAAANRKVLSTLFPKYLSDARYCRDDVDVSGAEDYLAAMRKAGQIVPAIIDIATGSFTAAGQNQIAYVISVGECNASHADNFGSKRLAIFSGNQLVFNADANFKSGILKKTDLDLNGINELLLLGGDMHQGILVETAALYEVRKNKLVVVKDFVKVFEDSCASLLESSSIDASVIFLGAAKSGQMPAFEVENYRARCGRVKRWKFMSKGVMPF